MARKRASITGFQSPERLRIGHANSTLRLKQGSSPTVSILKNKKMITFSNHPPPSKMDSRLDETEDLITSVEGTEDEAPIQKIANVRIGILGTSQNSDVMNFPPLQRRNYKKKFKETLESTGEMRQMWIEHTKSLKKSASKFSQSNQETPNRTTPYE